MEKWAREILARKAYEAYHRYLDEMVGKSGTGKTVPFDEKEMSGKIGGKVPVRDFVAEYIVPQAKELDEIPTRPHPLSLKIAIRKKTLVFRKYA